MKTLAKWSVDDYHRMIEAGILRDRRVELLAGEIVEIAPETPIHYSTVKRGVKYLEELLIGKADIRFNGPVTLANSEPAPDIAIVRLPESNYNNRHPAAEDIFWLVEVAKTSLKKDLAIKAAIYATAEIPEYWVLNLVAKHIIVFQNPQNGQYSTEQIIDKGTITPLSFPEIQVLVERLLS
ncbi:MAG: Uma2 family endonuclease [Nostoc sp. ChiSLP02]|nr:Uma2 family endonuclease [Nostoc sp. DedSLP05]MDZ8100576.1 Uma2 family endonuclease [Nostoc sp. DedSLP01]MDZ8189584.1 Uma2 family endonuclease [Nostoc sp. ChiSLP02]